MLNHVIRLRITGNESRIGILSFLLSIGAINLGAQLPTESLHFEAASVRQDVLSDNPREASRTTGGPGSSDSGRISYMRQPLYVLIQNAYDVPAFRIRGNLENARNIYTVTATMPPTTTNEEFRVMLRNLLTERFHLKVHHENLDLPGYSLTVAPEGLRIQKWIPDPAAPSIGSGRPGQPGYLISPAPQQRVHVKSRLTMGEFAKNLPGLIFMSDNMRGDSFRDESLLSGLSARDPAAAVVPTIIDKTALSGTYEFDLDFEGSYIPRESAGGPTIFEAIEKLGLKLVKERALPTDILFLDSVDKNPSEN